MKRKTWWRVVGLLLVLLAVVLSLLLRSLGAGTARRVVLRELRARVPADVEVGSVDFSFVPPALAIHGLVIRDGPEELLRAASIDFRLAILASLWEGAWIGELEISDFDVAFEENAALWQKLSKAVAEARSGGGAEPSFLPRAVRIRRGRLHGELKKLGLRATIEDLDGSADLRGFVTQRLGFEISAHGAVERAGAKLGLAKVALRGEARPAGITIDSGVVEGDGGRLRVHGDVDAQRLRGKVDWQVVLDPIFALVPEAGVVRGGGRISAVAQGSPSTPELAAELEAKAVRIHNVEFSGAGHMLSHGVDWELRPAHAQMFGGAVEGDARGRFTAGVPFEVRGRFQGWDPATFVRLFGPQTPLRGSWDGEAHLDGLLFGDDLNGGGSFTLQEAKEQLSGHARFTTTKETAEVEGTIESAAADRLRCRYQVDHGSISGEAQEEGQRLSVFGPFIGLSLAGKGRGKARFEGTVSDPRFVGEVEAEALAVEGIEFGRVRGPFEISRQGLLSRGFEIDDARIRVAGRVALTPEQENDWRLRAAAEPLENITRAARALGRTLPDLGGALGADLQVVGGWSEVRMGGRFQIPDLSIRHENVGGLSGQIAVGKDGWAGRGQLRGSFGGQAELLARIEPSRKLAAHVSASGWRIERIDFARHLWPTLKGTVALSGSVAGSLDRPAGDASLVLGGLELSGEPLGDAVLDVRMDGERAVLGARSGDRLKLTGTIGLESPHPFAAQGEWSDVDIAAILVPRSNLKIALRGSGQIRGDANQILRDGTARVDELSVSRERLNLSNRAPIEIRVHEGVIEVPDTVLDGEGQRITLGGRLGPDESQVHAVGTSDLALLEAISPAVASARGALTASLTASRHGDGPWSYRGTARVEDGAIDVGFLLSVTEISGSADFNGRRAEIRELTGILGGGRFLAEGALSLDTGWNVGWGIRDASLGFPPWLDYRASGNGKLQGLIEAPRLEGEVEINQAVYDRRIEWAEFLPWFRREARMSPSTLSVPLQLDLHVFADGGLFVDNNLAKTEMRADFRVAGSGSSPTLAGRLDVLSGEFTFRRRSFTITAGTVQFAETQPINPDLEFSGETTVSTTDGDYQIFVRVSGTADRPRIQFTADDSSLTENDVLALVTFGRTVAQLQSQGAGFELNEVLALTAGAKAGIVEERIYSFLPVDRIEIEPTFSRTTGANEPRLSIGKDLAQGLRAVLGTGLGSERRQDVALEYQLTPRIFVQGNWESQTKSEAGAFGGDLKFRIPFRNVLPFSLLPSLSRSEGNP